MLILAFIITFLILFAFLPAIIILVGRREQARHQRMLDDRMTNSGNTVADLREVAIMWDNSARYCDECGEPGLAARDRRFAEAMREAASILEALRMDS